MEEYVPDVGDIIWLNFNPQAGHRPAVVLTPKAYNDLTSLLICCPLTTKSKGYPFEVHISGRNKNVALSDQVKSLDWRVRKAEKKGEVNTKELSEIRKKIASLLMIGNGRQIN